ncbi:uncharacterized protein LOC144437991 [Glandiceps talaboti]
MIRFIRFSVETSEDCAKDRVILQDVSEERSTIITKKEYCGTTAPPRWLSSTSHARVTLVSDDTIEARGYKASYELLAHCNIWHVGHWSECSVTCGTGMRFRSVLCRNRATDQIVSEDQCEPPRYVKQEICTRGKCARETRIAEVDYDPQWYTAYYKITRDYRAYQDFWSNYVHDHGFGRVMREDPPDWKGIYNSSCSISCVIAITYAIL